MENDKILIWRGGNFRTYTIYSWHLTSEKMTKRRQGNNIQKECDRDMNICDTKGPWLLDWWPKWKIILSGSWKWVVKIPRLKIPRSAAARGPIHLCRQGWSQQRRLMNETAYYRTIGTVSQGEQEPGSSCLPASVSILSHFPVMRPWVS